MSLWLMTPEPQPDAKVKLFCVPHAGRGASLFAPWRQDLPPGIELNAVQLPGRERRHAEPSLRRIPAIAEAMAAALLPVLDRPYALFGHSMGALLCYEATRVLRRLGAPLPLALFLSGRRAPNVPDDEPPIHALSDAGFVTALCERYNGIPQIILDQPDMMRMLLPAMRSDIEAIETYRHVPEAPLAMPFVIMGGRDDPQLTPPNIAGWRSLTTGSYRERLFPGGHFYLQEDRAPLVSEIAGGLTALAPMASPAVRPVTAGARWDR
jgi:medium-chain acyl-[acyl-carrier-protein] hydrolase